MTKEALTLALEALEKALRYHGVMLLSDPPQNAWKYHRVEQTADEAIAAIKEALAQPEQDADRFCDANCTWSDHHPDCKYGKPEQEPVAWITQGGKGWLRWHNKNDDHLNKTSVPLYKHPKRKPLSDAEIALISAECSLRTPSDIYFARAIEAAHGIKE